MSPNNTHTHTHTHTHTRTRTWFHVQQSYEGSIGHVLVSYDLNEQDRLQ